MKAVWDKYFLERRVYVYRKVDRYIPPEENKVAQYLKWFQGQKLVLMVYWISYSQLGLVYFKFLEDRPQILQHTSQRQTGMYYHTGHRYRKDRDKIKNALKRLQGGEIW